MTAPADTPVLEHKSIAATTESGLLGTDDTTGVVEAIVSVTGVEDQVKDIIEPGAYKDTLAKRTPKGVFAHDWGRWVAKTLDIRELMPGDSRLPRQAKDGRPWPAAAGALYVKCQFNLATREGKDAYENVKFFSDGGGGCDWSIGYQVPPGKGLRTKDGRRRIRSLDLFEYGPVLFGAESRTGTLSVKSITERTPGPTDDGDALSDLDPVTAEADEDDPNIAELHQLALDQMDDDEWDQISQAAAIADPNAAAGEPVDMQEDLFDASMRGRQTKQATQEGAGSLTVDVPAIGGGGETKAAKVSDTPWSNFKESDYTPEQWHRACLIHLHGDGGDYTKDDCKLPVREPDGTLNRNGVHAAAAALAGARTPLQAPASEKAAARAALRRLYSQIGDTPPESLQGKMLGDAAETKVAGQEATPADVAATERLKRWYVAGGGAARIRWGVPGDFDRCARIAGKFMRPDQAHGFCQLRHKDATGAYAGHAPAELAERAAEHAAGRKDLAMNRGPGGRPISGSSLADDATDRAFRDGDGDEGMRSHRMAAELHRGASKTTGDDAMRTYHQGMANMHDQVAAGMMGGGGAMQRAREMRAEMRHHQGARMDGMPPPVSGGGGQSDYPWQDGGKALAYDPALEEGPHAGHVPPYLEQKASQALPGSLEEHLATVEDAVRNLLGGASLTTKSAGSAVIVNGTWPDRVVATRYSMDGGGGESFEMAYSPRGDGSIRIGEVAPVTLVVSEQEQEQKGLFGEETPEAPLSAVPVMVGHVASYLSRTLQTKAGRVLSDSNAKLLRSAVDQLLTVLKAAGIEIDIPASGGENDAEDQARDEQETEPLYLPDTTAPAAQVTSQKVLIDPQLAARALRIHAAAHAAPDDS